MGDAADRTTLPTDWVQVEDGIFAYYSNVATGETKWSPPHKGSASGDSAAVLAKRDAVAKADAARIAAKRAAAARDAAERAAAEHAASERAAAERAEREAAGARHL